MKKTSVEKLAGEKVHKSIPRFAVPLPFAVESFAIVFLRSLPVAANTAHTRTVPPVVLGQSYPFLAYFLTKE